MAGKAAVFAGFISIAVLFLVYSRYQNPEMIIPAFDDEMIFDAGTNCKASRTIFLHRIRFFQALMR